MVELLRLLGKADFYAQAYADDGLIVITGKHLNHICRKMQKACDIVEEWCNETGLSANPEKTDLILFTKKGYQAPKLHGTSLERKKEVKYLGVILNEKLN